MDAENSPLNESALEVLQQARSLVAGDPPLPWKRGIIVPAAGVLAAGWTQLDNIVLVSVDGYSVTNPQTGERLVRDRNFETTKAALSTDHLHFQIPESGESIDIFGVWGGEGIHTTVDHWGLEKIYPWWPREDVLVVTPSATPYKPNSDEIEFFQGMYLIKTERLDGWLKCGFSPSGKHFAIVGSGGAEIFSR